MTKALQALESFEGLDGVVGFVVARSGAGS